jgi:hypothetical protein
MKPFMTTFKKLLNKHKNKQTSLFSRIKIAAASKKLIFLHMVTTEKALVRENNVYDT